MERPMTADPKDKLRVSLVSFQNWMRFLHHKSPYQNAKNKRDIYFRSRNWVILFPNWRHPKCEISDTLFLFWETLPQPSTSLIKKQLGHLNRFESLNTVRKNKFVFSKQVCSPSLEINPKIRYSLLQSDFTFNFYNLIVF